ncbi:MAG: flagellar biosynthesis protein FlhB, partial [Pseudomonadota bacterium]
MAESQDDSQKTEEPTAKRLSEARERGDVPVSREIINFSVIIFFVLSGVIFFPYIFYDMTIKVRYFIEFSHQIAFTDEEFKDLYFELFVQMAYWVLPIGVGIVIFVILSNVAQNGFLWAPQSLALKFERLNPINGFKQMFSVRKLVDLAKDIFKLTALVLICFTVTLLIMQYLDVFADYSLENILKDVYYWTIILLISSVVFMAPVAFTDLIFQRFQHRKKLRMTRHELKQELKQTEGDPEVKARIRRIRAQRHNKKMMQDVPKADVVITNPTHYAVALLYEPNEMEAPRIIAKGQDHIAMRIRQIAEANDITIYQDPPLARALYGTVEVGEEIPTEHYLAVSAIIRYVFKLKGKQISP